VDIGNRTERSRLQLRAACDSVLYTTSLPRRLTDEKVGSGTWTYTCLI